MAVDEFAPLPVHAFVLFDLLLEVLAGLPFVAAVADAGTEDDQKSTSAVMMTCDAMRGVPHIGYCRETVLGGIKTPGSP